MQFVFGFETDGDAAGDIVLAGPAEPWIHDASGRPVGIASGRPVLLLEDLAVALRAFRPEKRDRPFLGCTIDPTADGLAALMDFMRSSGASIVGAGNTALIGLVVFGVVIYAAVWLIRRAMRGPTPEETARKLMEQFAEKNGVAAYVFAGDDSAEDEAASIGALTRPENKSFRQRRPTQSNRTLASSLTRLLNRPAGGDTQTLLH